MWVSGSNYDVDMVFQPVWQRKAVTTVAESGIDKNCIMMVIFSSSLHY